MKKESAGLPESVGDPDWDHTLSSEVRRSETEVRPGDRIPLDAESLADAFIVGGMRLECAVSRGVLSGL